MTHEEPDMRERCQKEAEQIHSQFYRSKGQQFEIELITTALLKREKEIEELKKNNILDPWKIIDGLKKDRETAKNNWIACKEKLKAVEAEHCEECNFPLTDFGTPKGLECQLCNARDKIESITSQLKIVSDLIKAPCNMDTTDLQKLNAWKQALQKISEVGK